MVNRVLLTAWLATVALLGCSPAERADRPAFTDVAREAGLQHVSATYAAAVADYDKDGWLDLAVSNHGQVVVLRNDGTGVFEAAIELDTGDTHGVSWIDFDNDGWLDLYVSMGAGRGFGKGDNVLYRNVSGRTLDRQPHIAEPLADPLGRGRCSVPWDIDLDGQIDLLVLNAHHPDRPHRLVEIGGAPAQDKSDPYGLRDIDAECLTALWIDDSTSPLFAAYGSGSDSGHTFRMSDATAILEDRTDELGITATGTTYFVAAGDYDNDGDLDLYYVRGHGVPSGAVVEDQTLRFRLVDPGEASPTSLRFETRGEMLVDFNIGGHHDPSRVLFGAHREQPPSLPWTVSARDPMLEGEAVPRPEDAGSVLMGRLPGGGTTVQFVSDLPRWRAASGTIRASEGIELLEGPRSNPRPTKNRLFENRLGRFVDVTDQAGVGDASSGRDAVFFDMDNDGDLDLFVVNGGTAFSNQPDVLYRNNGDRTFDNITAEVGLEGPARGRGATVVALDIDNDFDLDLFVTNGDGPPGGNRGPYVLWRNDLPQGRSARLDLRGPSGNTAAFGVRVRLETPRLVLLQQRRATSSRFSTSVSPIHLGLGSLDEARVVVEWPGGDRETLTVVPGESVELVQAR